jgi:hypothetical protein
MFVEISHAAGQWSVVSGQLSVVSRCQLSVVSGQWSVVSCQWSVVSGQLSVVGCRLSVSVVGVHRIESISIRGNRRAVAARPFDYFLPGSALLSEP